MIDVVRDEEGVRQALEDLFEEDLARARIERQTENADPRTKERMLAQLPQRKLSPGYYRFAEHLLRLESEQRAGIGFAAGSLSGFEADGLLTLQRARGAFNFRHPPCSACGVHQPTRFGVECSRCGVKFRRRK